MTKQERLTLRNNHVRKLFRETELKNPKWRRECVVEEVAKKVFLSERTVEAIIGYEGIYGETITNKNQDNGQMSMF